MFNTNFLNKTIGIFHFGCGLIKNIHIILFPSFVLGESIFIASYCLTPLSWILCNDECIISYFVKKINNPQYCLGEQPYNYQDIENICFSKYIYNITFHLNTLLQIMSLITIKNNHERLNTANICLAIIIKTIYIYDIKYDTNIRKISYPWFQITMASSFTGLLLQWFSLHQT